MKEKINLPSLTPVEFVSVLQEELFQLFAYEEWEMDQQIEKDQLLFDGVSNFFKRLYSAPTIIPLGDNSITYRHNPYGLFSFDNQKVIVRPFRSMVKPKEITTLSERRRMKREAREGYNHRGDKEDDFL